MNQIHSYTLPELKVPENTPEGFKIIPEYSQKQSPVGYVIINCFVSAILLYFLSLLIYYFSNNLKIAVAICCGIFILRFLYLAVWCLRLYKRRKFEHSGELFLSEHPLKLGGSYQIHYRRPLRSGATFEDLSWVGRFVRLKIRTIRFHRLTPETILAWAEKRIQAVKLPEVKQVGLKLDRADIEPIVGNAGASWREVATYLHIWAAKIAIAGNREQGTGNRQ